MSSNEKNPIIEKELSFSYTKGVYRFFCANIAKLFLMVFAILASAATVVTGLKADQLVSALWIVHHNARKLEGIDSISSSVHDNCLCARWRKLIDCICSHCYAYNQQSYQTGLKEHNILNGIILRNILLPVVAFKRLQFLSKIIRIESFGDVANVIQARNYIRIIKAFPRKRCAIWSKNIEIWAQAFELEGKPENTTFVFSSPYIDKIVPESIIDKYPFIDHIFTVFTKKYAKKNNIIINCGGRKCMDCIKKKINCYFRNNTLYINELLK